MYMMPRIQVARPPREFGVRKLAVTRAST